MSELRKDYLLDEWVIIATEREKRPKQFMESILEKLPEREDKCFFCPGNENLTPPEIMRVGDENNWKIRVFANKFPAVTQNEFPQVNQEFERKKPALGKHEIVVETSRHDLSLKDLSIDELVDVLKVYSNRFVELMKDEKTKEVNVFKNLGPGSGASLEHSHTQIISLNKESTSTKNEKNAMKEYSNGAGKCAYCSIIEKETYSPRNISKGKIVSFTPYASKWPFEVMIFPKEQRANLSELSEEELHDFAEVLGKLLKALGKLNAPYNYYIHQKESNYHMHLRIAPRLSTRGGFEEQTGIIINTVSPEKAAEFYRENFK